MPLTALFVRHGESTANVERVFANRAEPAFDLTPTGRAQATTLAERLRGEAITHILTSPLARAAQTAAIVGDALGIRPVTTDALREYDVGHHEDEPYHGDHAWRLTEYDEIERRWRAGDDAARHPEGESLADLLQRFLPLVASLANLHAASDVVLLVGHGGLYRAVLPRLFTSVSPGFVAAHPLAHGGVVRAEWRDGKWECLDWDGSRHWAVRRIG